MAVKAEGTPQVPAKELKIGDKEDKEEREIGRAVSKVKRALMEASPDLSGVVIDRRIGEVYVGRKRVAR